MVGSDGEVAVEVMKSVQMFPSVGMFSRVLKWNSYLGTARATLAHMCCKPKCTNQTFFARQSSVQKHTEVEKSKTSLPWPYSSLLPIFAFSDSEVPDF